MSHVLHFSHGSHALLGSSWLTVLHSPRKECWQLLRADTFVGGPQKAYLMFWFPRNHATSYPNGIFENPNIHNQNTHTHAKKDAVCMSQRRQGSWSVHGDPGCGQSLSVGWQPWGHPAFTYRSFDRPRVHANLMLDWLKGWNLRQCCHVLHRFKMIGHHSRGNSGI